MTEVEASENRRTVVRILLAVLFSAALIWLTGGHSPSQLNKVVPAEAKARSVQVRRPEKLPQATTVVKDKTPTEPVAVPRQKLSPKEDLMRQAGIPQRDWSATDYIISHESSWRPTARNASSGAYGLCQAYPASKMASAGKDYMSNPVTQLKWCHEYAHSRYGGWWSSFAAWRSQRWW
jgi:hypothetical protein